MSYKKCDIRPWNCPDIESQKLMIQKIKAIEEECIKDWSILLFEDAVHQLHTTHNWYAIQFKGKENTKVLATNTWRNRLTILWAINPNWWKFTSITTKQTCNIEFMKLFLDAVSRDYAEKISEWRKVYIVLDNARYQKAYEVQNYAKKLWITLEYLPAYCPHLNIIERLWKWMKRQLRNIYIEKFDTFCEFVLWILWSIEQNYKDLKKILQTNFGVI